jgi:general secretion pathway protein K
VVLQASRSSRSGSVSLVAVGVLAVCAVLLTGAQTSLRSSATALRIRQNQQALRTACVLGLREGMGALQQDSIPAFDDPREDWGTPLRFVSSDQVEITVAVTDAQSRFNVNRLMQPLSPTMLRTPEQMFADLVAISGLEIEMELVRHLSAQLRDRDIALQDPRELVEMDPIFQASLPAMAPNLIALPPPASGSHPVNLNTVNPAVLSAILGPQLDGWVEQVVLNRESAPIPSLGAVASGLPPVAQTLLSRVVDVRSEYFLITVTAQTDAMEQVLTALVHRPAPQTVEVVRCQW